MLAPPNLRVLFLHFGWNFGNLVRQARETVEMQEIKLIWFNYTSSLSLDLYLMHTAHEFESIQYTEYCKIYVMCIQFVIELECLNLNWGLQHWRHITWILIRLSTVAQTAHTVREQEGVATQWCNACLPFNCFNKNEYFNRVHTCFGWFFSLLSCIPAAA